MHCDQATSGRTHDLLTHNVFPSLRTDMRSHTLWRHRCFIFIVLVQIPVSRERVKTSNIVKSMQYIIFLRMSSFFKADFKGDMERRACWWSVKMQCKYWPKLNIPSGLSPTRYCEPVKRICQGKITVQTKVKVSNISCQNWAPESSCLPSK